MSHWTGTWDTVRCKERIRVMDSDRVSTVQCSLRSGHDGAHRFPTPGKGRPPKIATPSPSPRSEPTSRDGG